MKKFLVVLICVLSLFIVNVRAESTDTKEKIMVYIFSKDGCSHCEAAKAYFAEIEKDYGKYFELVNYQVYDLEWNIDEYYKGIMDDVASTMGDTVEGVPYIVIGSDYSANGFAESMEEEIKEEIVKAYEDENYKDVVAEAVKKAGDTTQKEDNESANIWIIIGIFVVVIGGCSALVAFSRKK